MEELKKFIKDVLEEEPEEEISKYETFLRGKGIRKPSQLRDDLLPRERLLDEIPEVFVNQLYNAAKKNNSERVVTLAQNKNSSFARKFTVDWEDIGRKKQLTDATPIPEGILRGIIRDAVTQMHRALGFINVGTRVRTDLAEQLVEKYPHHFLNKKPNGGTSRSFSVTYKRIEKNSEYQVTRYNGRRKKKQKVPAHVQYATVRFAPELPTDSLVTAEWKKMKRELRDYYEQTRSADWDFNKISKDMKTLFADLRNDIKEKTPSIQKLLKKWPFLLQPKILMEHFNHLMDISLEEKINAFDEKIDLLIDYYVSFSTKHETCEKFKVQMNRSIQGANTASLQARLIATIMMACEVLNPGKFKQIYRHVKELDTENEELEALQDLENTPLIISLGPNHWVSSAFCIMIEQRVVARVDNFKSALAYFFAAFFVFNMQYTEGVGDLMEYIERFMMCIALNEEPGSKKKAKVGKTVKLQNLLTSISEYESKRAEWIQAAADLN